MASPEKYISKHTYIVTEKQAEVLNIIARANADGSFVDRHQIRDRVSYDPHINCIIFILRYMLAQKRIEIVGREKRLSGAGRICNTAVYKITGLGRSFIVAL